MITDEHWMKIAIEEAHLALTENEIPVGAVLVNNNKLIAQSHNQPINKNDPTAHAEIQVLRKAGQLKKNYRLTGSCLYVTLEPCLMCIGAMIHARIERVIFGAFDSKNRIYSYKDLSSNNIFNHSIIYTGGVLEKESSQLLKHFFSARRIDRAQKN